MENPRKTLSLSKDKIRALLQSKCTVEGREYKRLAAGDVTGHDDICITTAIPGAVVADTGMLAYYRLVPPPPPAPPSKRVLERVRAGEGTAEEIALLAVWAEHQIKR